MRGSRTLIAIVITAAAGAPAALGGDFNACRVTYGYDGILLINGERFFPTGTYFLPPGYPEGGPTPTINEAYAAYAANGGNILLCPRYYNMYGATSNDPYGVHGLPSDLYHTKGECVDHTNVAHTYNVKLMTSPHIYWWWDADWRPENLDDPYPGPHPIWSAASYWGWQIEQTTMNERFSSLEPDGGIKGWVEDGEPEAFMGWHHWHEAGYAWWYGRYDTGPREYPRSPTPEPDPGDMQVRYGWLRTLEDDPAVNAEHPTFFFDFNAGRIQDLWPAFFDCVEMAGVNPVPVPEPYISYYRDAGEGSWLTDSMLPNYHCAVTGDSLDVLFETLDAKKPGICVVQNHYLPCTPWEEYGDDPMESQYRFMTYDAVIHRANGILYGLQAFGWIDLYTGEWVIAEGLWDPCKPTLNEIGQSGLMHDVLKAEYDNILVEVITRPFGGGDPIEKSAFIGGDLAPKNHFLSDNITMEGCAKMYDGFTYLIVARRDGIDQKNPSYSAVTVTFRPYFSSKTPWTGTVEVVGEQDPFGGTRTINISNGTFTDEFVEEQVHIYKFSRPTPYYAAE